MNLKQTASITVAVAALVTQSPTSAAAPPAAPDPSNFVSRVDNPWFPLHPGITLRYKGEKDGAPQRDVMTVTHKTKTILGINAIVVHDRVFFRGGGVAEDTLDWYAQDKHGNVWYLGEATKELARRGHVKSREGSWQAGAHGARAGIVMPGHPKIGETHRMEFEAGNAEDYFRVKSLHASVTVPAVSSRRALRTTEWTPLEPGVRDAKYYVRGIGSVLEVTVKGANERFELVSVERR
jgi:hypothetical protein